MVDLGQGGEARPVVESFDDVTGQVDSVWKRGSVLTIQYDAVPEPATFAALGLGVAVLLRRRRKN